MAALRDPSAPGYNIARDPTLAKNRIYVGNIPACTREELESICHPYGKVLGSLVQKNFGFVQFESEEIANKCAVALNKSTFKSKALIVRNATVKSKPANANAKKANSVGRGPGGGQVPMAVQAGIVMSTNAAAAIVAINDCEIIVCNRENTKYAEFIESRLVNAGLRVDVLFPNEDVQLGQVLSSISARGCLYAVLVTPQHEALNSITVNILYGVPAEHRNMPLDDAIQLIGSDFLLKKQHDAVSQMHSVQGRHPEAMQKLLAMLADGHPLTGLQYECVIKYLEELREKQLKLELGDANAMAKPDPEIELQKKILSIMNKPAVTELNSDLMYNTFEDAKGDARLMEMLQDRRIMKALKSIYTPDLIETLSQYF